MLVLVKEGLMKLSKWLWLPFLGLLTACTGAVDELIVNMMPRPQEPKNRPYEIRDVTFLAG